MQYQMSNYPQQGINNSSVYSPQRLQQAPVVHYANSPNPNQQQGVTTSISQISQQPQQRIYQSYQPQIQQPNNQVYYVSQQQAVRNVPEGEVKYVEFGSEIRTQSTDKDTHLCLRCCIWIFPLLFAIAAIIAASLLLHKIGRTEFDFDTEAQNVVQFGHDNMAAEPINSLQMVDSDEDCPDDMTEAAIVKWYGTDKGCLCDDGLLYTDITYCGENSCDVVQDTIDPIDSPYWYTNGIYRKICYGRITDTYYKTTDETCNEGDTFCSPNICMQEDEACPYNNLEVTSRRRNLFESHTNNHLSDDQDGILTLDTDTYTFSYVEGGTTIYMQIMATTGDYPCFDPTLCNEVQSGLLNPFQKIQYSGCGTYEEYQLIDTLDSQLMSTIYEGSSSIQTALEDVYDADVYYGNTEDYLKLYAQQRIDYDVTNEACHDIDNSFLTSVFVDQDSLYSWLYGLSICIIILSVVIIILSLVLFFTKIISSNNLLWTDTKKETIQLYLIGFILVVFCFIVGMIYFHDSRISGGFYDAAAYYLSYHDSGCYDADELVLFNTAIASNYIDVNSIIELVVKYVIAIFYSGLIFFLFSIVLISMKYIYLSENVVSTNSNSFQGSNIYTNK